MRLQYLVLIAIGLSAFTGCSTVQSRIKERPEVFNQLPERQKALVTEGRVTEGMSRDAVYLSWGNPDDISRGSERNKPVEEWIYEASRTELVSSFRPSPILYDRYGRYYGGFRDIYEPILVSRPYPYKSAIFERGNLVAWREKRLR